MLVKNNPRFIPLPKEVAPPFKSAHGWYILPSERGIRVEGSVWVYGDAQVSGNARVYGDARVYGGKLIGHALMVQTYAWAAHLAAPGIVAIGCQVHPIVEWLRPRSRVILWGAHCTPAERRAIQRAVRALAAMEKLGHTWAKEKAE